MYQKNMGFAVVALLVFAACHNIFNKDKAIPSTQPAIVNKVSEKKDTVKVATIKHPAVINDTTLKYVYLTFDDGPDAGTMNCYNVCRSTGVKATFFLVGAHANHKHGKLILDTMKKDMRHFLFANHSYTHAAYNSYQSFYSKPDKALEDFLRVHDSLKFEVPIARFPGNNVWQIENTTRATKLTRPLSRLMDSIGYNVLGWDVEWKFNRKNEPIQSAELMAKEVIDAVEKKTSVVKNHVVLLAHDRMFKEEKFRDSLAKMISIIQTQKGYIFETANQYPKLKKHDRKLIASRK